MNAGPRPDGRLPVTLLTGFLGSGKTTLLARLLADPALADTAVVINEFGAVGLDHHLLQRLDGETVLLDGGCICCSVRDGLADTLARLLQRLREGSVPRFARIVIETTGLADPAPILATLMADPRLAATLRLHAVLTTVDAVHGVKQLDEHLESVRQVALADRLLVTKSDLAAPAGVAALRARLARINPDAEVLVAERDATPVDLLLAPAPTGPRQVHADHEEHQHHCGPGCGHHHHRHAGVHDQRVQSHVWTFDEPLDWELVAHWLGSLAFFHGDKVLRIKGLLALQGEAAPVAVHAVRHLVHEPTPLRHWPDADHRSRLVFITCDLGRDAIAAALRQAREDTTEATLLME